MPRPLVEILRLAYERSAAQSGYLQQLRDIDDLYYGNVDIGIPELQQRNNRLEVANLAMQGVDQHGMRIASVMPDLVFPPLRSTGTARARADQRRRAMFGLWDENSLDVALHLRARHLISYAAAPVQLRPKRLMQGRDAGWKPDNGWTVEWVLRTPHETFPAGGVRPGVHMPEDCVFRYSRSFRWLQANYPMQAATIARVRGEVVGVVGVVAPQMDREVEVVEYVDGGECVLAATGMCDWPPGMRSEASYGLAEIFHLAGWSAGSPYWGVELERYPNRCGVCPVVVPGRITLGKAQGQFDQMLGLFLQQAKLMALELNAVTRSVFPDVYVEDADPNTPASIEPANGLRGKVGKVHGGKLHVVQLSPGFQTYPTIDRLAESQRQIGLVPAEFGGYSPTNIRTGARGRDVVSSTVDFSIQEAQLLFQRSLKAENDIAIEIAKTYFAGSRKRYAVSWPGAKGDVDYRPEQLFEDGATHSVEYSAVGSDANMLGVQIAQANGTGLMSDETARRSHPLIKDADFENRQSSVERLRKALEAGFEQRVAAGAVPEIDVAAVIKARLAGDEIEDATVKADEAARARQASAGQPGTAEAPVAPGTPEAQAGLATPGAGAEAGTAGAAADQLGGLSQLVSHLRNTGRPVAA